MPRKGGNVQTMQWWAWMRQFLFGRAASTAHSEVIVHDFTFTFNGHVLSRVKLLDEGERVFVAGESTGLKVGDIVVIRTHAGAPRIRYRIESLQTRSDGTFRAYGHLDRQISVRTPSKSFTNEFTPQARMQRTEDKWYG